MGSYYKHKRTESARVPYSFQCEQCMKDSGPLTATVKGTEATHNSNYKVLTDKEQIKLQETAHKYLVRDLYKIYQDASEKNIIATEFKDECPHCHKPQSWGVTGMKKKMFDTPITILIVGAFLTAIFVGGYYLGEIDILTPAYAVAGITVLIAALVLVFNMIKVSAKTKKTSTSNQKNLPDIQWAAVQELLNEKR